MYTHNVKGHSKQVVFIYLCICMAIIQEKETINLRESEERLGRAWRNGTWQGLERGNMAEVRERKWKDLM